MLGFVALRGLDSGEASGVTVKTVLPDDLELLSLETSTGSPCELEGRTLTCDLGAADQPANCDRYGDCTLLGGWVRVEVKPTEPGGLTVSGVVEGDQPDPDPSNNTDERTVGVIRAFCAGRKATVVGAPSKDWLHGTDDVIVSFGGDDEIWTHGGTGVLSCAGAGDDVLRPSWYTRARDRLFGGRGNDKLYGGRGQDKLRGNGGRDQLDGGPDPRKDLLAGGSGNDRIEARDGRRDDVRCGRGWDRVFADRSDLVARSCERVTRWVAS